MVSSAIDSVHHRPAVFRLLVYTDSTPCGQIHNMKRSPCGCTLESLVREVKPALAECPLNFGWLGGEVRWSQSLTIESDLGSRKPKFQPQGSDLGS
jgi:hypothetical protein